MGIETKFDLAVERKCSRRAAAWALPGVMLLAAGCAQAQSAAQSSAQNTASLRWFDGTRWVDSTAAQGAAQAAGGVVVMVPVAQAAALQAALTAQGLSPRPLAVAGAYELATPAGADALLLTHRLVDLPQRLGVPVQVAPNWRTPMLRR